jgi:hypothetical protein
MSKNTNNQLSIVILQLMIVKLEIKSTKMKKLIKKIN